MDTLNSLIEWATSDLDHLLTLGFCFLAAAAAAYTVSR